MTEKLAVTIEFGDGITAVLTDVAHLDETNIEKIVLNYDEAPYEVTYPLCSMRSYRAITMEVHDERQEKEILECAQRWKREEEDRQEAEERAEARGKVQRDLREAWREGWDNCKRLDRSERRRHSPGGRYLDNPYNEDKRGLWTS